MSKFLLPQPSLLAFKFCNFMLCIMNFNGLSNFSNLMLCIMNFNDCILVFNDSAIICTYYKKNRDVHCHDSEIWH